MTDHPTPDALADLDAGLPVDAQVSSHVAGCADCAADLEQIRSVSRLLADLPAEPLPADIAARIDTALAAERARISAPATVVPLQSRPRRAVPSWIAAAAAGVALFGGAAFLLNNLNGRSSDSSGGGLSASRVNEKNVIRNTGSDYRAGTLADQLPTLLGTAPGSLDTMSGGGTPPTALGSESLPGVSASKSADSSVTVTRQAARLPPHWAPRRSRTPRHRSPPAKVSRRRGRRLRPSSSPRSPTPRRSPSAWSGRSVPTWTTRSPSTWPATTASPR